MSLEASLAVGSRSTLCLPWQETTRWITAKSLLLAPTPTACAEEQTLSTRSLPHATWLHFQVLHSYVFISDLKPHPGHL